MKKKIFFVFLNLLFFSCKDGSKSELKANTINVKDSIVQSIDMDKRIINEEIQNTEENEDCNKTLIDFIKSSTLSNPFKENLTCETEDINNYNLRIILYYESNIVGTLLFDAQNYKLFDLTNDIENPEELNFNSKKWNTIIDCYFKKNKKYYVDYTTKSNNDCKTKDSGMDHEETCIIKNSTIKDVYLDLIKNSLVDKSEKLKKTFPQKTEETKVDTDGLISIDYIINRKKLYIEMSFEGGVTTILLEEIENNVKRTITISAD